MGKIEELRGQYYETIRLLQDEEDIRSALPRPEYESFFPLINGIIEMLNNELEKTLTMDINDSEMKEAIAEEIRIIKLKLDLCNNLLHIAKEDKKIEEDASKTPQKNIIFATTNSGNIRIENDLKNISEEYLGAIVELLTKLQNGTIDNNEQKARSFTSINKKLAGIQELKDFKVRLFYKNLSSDTVYVLMARMKKSDNDRLDREEIKDRASQSNKQYESLKKLIRDPDKKEELVNEHNKILLNILSSIDHKKRG